MKFKRKLLIAILTINVLICALYLNRVEVEATWDEINKGASDFISKGQDEAGDVSDVVSSVTNNFSGLGQVLTFVGAGIMVAAVAYMGIKYMTSSPDKQAVLKQQLVGLLVSGIVIFGAYEIWKLVLSIVQNF